MNKRRTRRQINIEKVAGVLTLDQLTRFIINCDEYGDELSAVKFGEKSIIGNGFSWSMSNEGYDYWYEIYDSISHE